jgi:predicted O-methyltransferase YrrM
MGAMADEGPQLWAEVDSYLGRALGVEDEVLAAALRASAEAGLPAINVSPLQGKFLHILARLVGAKKILEVGALGGYSAIWLGRALPEGGRLVTLELDERHAEVARANLQRARLAATVEVRVGPALENLPRLFAEEGQGAFDLAFIDADKPNNANYFAWALRLVRPGGAVVVDNVVRNGKVSDANSDDPGVVGSRRVLEAMGATPGGAAAALQTVGVKGYDGFAIAVVGPA